MELHRAAMLKEEKIEPKLLFNRERSEHSYVDPYNNYMGE